jgi:hypothetical protein
MMEQVIIRVIILSVIPIIVGILLSYITKSNNNELLKKLSEEHLVIHLPKAYMWVGFAASSFFAICFFLMVWFPNGTGGIWVGILFWIFILLGIVIVVETLIWRIQIFRHEEYLIYRTSFGRTYRIQYKDFVYYKNGNNTLILRTNNKSFFVDNKATNFEFLMAMLTQHKIKEQKN